MSSSFLRSLSPNSFFVLLFILFSCFSPACFWLNPHGNYKYTSCTNWKLAMELWEHKCSCLCVCVYLNPVFFSNLSQMFHSFHFCIDRESISYVKSKNIPFKRSPRVWVKCNTFELKILLNAPTLMYVTVKNFAA